MRIFINDIEVPFTEDLKIQASLLSSLFNAAGSDGSALFNFTLPGTDILYKAMGWKHRLNTPRPQDADFRLEHGSIKLNGTAILTQCDADNYEISVGVGKGDFNYLVKDLKLQDPDIDWGSCNPVVQSIFTGHILGFNSGMSSLVFPNIINKGIGSLDSTNQYYVAAESLTYIFSLNFYNWQTLTGNPLLGLHKITLSNDEIVIPYPTSLSSSQTISYTVFLNAGEKVICYISLDGGTYSNINPIKLTVIEKLNTNITDNISDCYPIKDYVFFPVQNDKLFDNISSQQVKDNYKNFKVVNFWDGEKFPRLWTGLNVSNAYVTIPNIFIPFLCVGFVLDKITQYFGYTIKNNFFKNSEWAQLVLINFYIDYTYNENGGNDTSMIPNSNMNLKNQLPDLLISDFMNSIAIITGCTLDINLSKKEIEFKPVNKIINSKNSVDWNKNYKGSTSKFDSLYNGYELKYETSNDNYISENFKSLNFNDISMENYRYIGELSSLSTSGSIPVGTYQLNDICYYTVDRKYYVWTPNSTTGTRSWILYSGNFVFDIVKNYKDARLNNLYSLSSKLIPIMRSDPFIPYAYNINNANTDWLLPITQQPGKFKYALETWDAAQMSGILFYRGMRPALSDYNYPFGDNHNTDINGNSTGNLSLRLDGANGVLSRQQDYLNFIITCRQLQIFKELDDSDIIQLAFDKKIIIEGKLVLLSEVKFSLGMLGIDTDEIWGFTA